MADYFLLLDAGLFEGQMRPALAASWRLRSFEPCRALCASLLSAAEDFAARYRVAEGTPLPVQVVRGLPFHRDFWRALVGELLFYAADEIPELQTCPDTLCCLLAPEHYRREGVPRAQFAPIQQAHFGTRDLAFGVAVYRPDHCGYNNLDDIRRLDAYLAGIDPGRWQPGDLAELREPGDPEERAEELEFARDWFPALQAMYRRAAAQERVLVHEVL